MSPGGGQVRVALPDSETERQREEERPRVLGVEWGRQGQSVSWSVSDLFTESASQSVSQSVC